MKYDRQPSRLDIPKVAKGKRVELGPTVTLDQERCILCTRCVRFMREVAKDAAARRRPARQRELHHDVPGPAARLEVRRQRGGHLPGRRAHLDRLPLPRPRLVHVLGAVRLHRLRPRLQHLPRLPERHDLPATAPGRTTPSTRSGCATTAGSRYKYLNTERVARGARGARRRRRRRSPRAAAAERGRGRARAARAGGHARRCCSRRSPRSRTCSSPPRREGRAPASRGLRGRPRRRLAGRLPEARRREPEPQGARARRAGLGLARAAVRRTSPRPSQRGAGEGGLGGRDRAPGRRRSPSSSAALEVLVAQAYERRPRSRRAATMLLPAAPHSETDGTFVNFEGRAQRFELAYFPRGEARPHWALAAEHRPGAAGSTSSSRAARDVFVALGPKLGARSATSSGTRCRRSASGSGIVPLAAGTVDGRLAGEPRPRCRPRPPRTTAARSRGPRRGRRP